MATRITFDEYGGTNTRDPESFNPSFTYNGKRWVDVELFRQTKHTTDHTYRQDIAELNCLFDALVQEGSIPHAVVKLEPADFAHLGERVSVPDFHVILRSALSVYVEVTAAGTNDTMRTFNTLTDMSVALTKWSVDNEDAQRALKGRPLSFVPQELVGGKDDKALPDEIRRFALTAPLEEYEINFGTKVNSKDYPLLTKLKTLVLYHATTADPAYVQVRPPASFYSPAEEYGTVLSAINRKIDNEYEHFRPLWLVVGISNVIEPWEETFEVVRASLSNMGPFERIYLANSNRALVAKARF